MSPANYPADLADGLFAFETGELDEEQTLQFFADLVASGWAWHLEGLYGRTAASLIEGGFLSEDGARLFGGLLIVSGLRERKLAELRQERGGRWPVRPPTLYRVK